MERLEIRVHGGVFLAMGLWLLILPLQWVIAVVLAAAVHEVGHLAALWTAGEQVHAVEIGISGARIVTAPLEPKTELVCALAGPAAGATACLFWQFAPELAIAAAMQTAFNLLPVYPLDGGRALRAIRKKGRA